MAEHPGTSTARTSSPLIRPGTLIAGTVLASAAAIAAAEAFKIPVDTSAPSTMLPTMYGRTHISRRSGKGPTVVFENGLGTPLTSWSWVVRHLPEDVPVMTYDRPGNGWSHGAPAKWRDAYPNGLLDLLLVTNIRPPIILVGHSIGGLLIRMFAEQAPEMVAGMVFVDPAPPGQYERAEDGQVALQRARQELDRLIVRRMLGRPIPPEWTTAMKRLPPELVEPSIRAMGRRRSLRSCRQELELSAGLWAESAARLTNTEHPVAVVTSEAVHLTDPDYAAELEEISNLSDVSRSEIVDGADHMSVVCDRWHAARVADAIQWVIDKTPQREKASW